MSVLVTGAAGFIGSHLVDRLLDAGETVVGLDAFDPFYDRTIKEANLSGAAARPGFRLVEGDVRNPELDARLPEEIDAVIHLAAKAGVRPSIEAPSLYADVNVTGTANLLDLAKRRGIRAFVFASSSSVYGDRADVPFRESDRADRPVSPYAATKRSGELLCHAASHLHGISTLSLRFFTVYGPRQRPDLAIRAFARHLLTDRPIPRFGDGSSARDYTHIADIIQGVMAALAWTRRVEAGCEVVNLGGSHPIELREMIRALGEAFGRTPDIQALPGVPGDVDRTFADLDHAKETLGYEPTIPFEVGLRDFAGWYERIGAAQDGL